MPGADGFGSALTEGVGVGSGAGAAFVGAGVGAAEVAAAVGDGSAEGDAELVGAGAGADPVGPATGAAGMGAGGGVAVRRLAVAGDRDAALRAALHAHRPLGLRLPLVAAIDVQVVGVRRGERLAVFERHRPVVAELRSKRQGFHYQPRDGAGGSGTVPTVWRVLLPRESVQATPPPRSPPPRLARGRRLSAPRLRPGE